MHSRPALQFRQAMSSNLRMAQAGRFSRALSMSSLIGRRRTSPLVSVEDKACSCSNLMSESGPPQKLRRAVWTEAGTADPSFRRVGYLDACRLVSEGEPQPETKEVPGAAQRPARSWERRRFTVRHARAFGRRPIRAGGRVSMDDTCGRLGRVETTYRAIYMPVSSAIFL
jgi:hypothetical protein